MLSALIKKYMEKTTTKNIFKKNLPMNGVKFRIIIQDSQSLQTVHYILAITVKIEVLRDWMEREFIDL